MASQTSQQLSGLYKDGKWPKFVSSLPLKYLQFCFTLAYFEDLSSIVRLSTMFGKHRIKPLSLEMEENSIKAPDNQKGCVSVE